MDGSAPNWLDRSVYPFESNYVELGPGLMHYVDEGTREGRPVVMLHGNPTWSFLYRHLLRELPDTSRRIAPDYFGFGLSDKPHDWSYRPEDHVRVFDAFLESLDLADMTLVLHDWGGPIGLSWAVQNPERVRGVVVLNSFAWPLESRWTRAFGWLAGGPIGRVLCERYNAFVRVVMPLAYADRTALTDNIHEQYQRPIERPRDRRGTWVFPRELVGSTDWLADLWEARPTMAEFPALIVWGKADPAFGIENYRRWEALYPEARSMAYDQVGHYVPEELGRELVPEVRTFLEQT